MKLIMILQMLSKYNARNIDFFKILGDLWIYVLYIKVDKIEKNFPIPFLQALDLRFFLCKIMAKPSVTAFTFLEPASKEQMLRFYLSLAMVLFLPLQKDLYIMPACV